MKRRYVQARPFPACKRQSHGTEFGRRRSGDCLLRGGRNRPPAWSVTVATKAPATIRVEMQIEINSARFLSDRELGDRSPDVVGVR